jgi:hypothetical protein
MFPKVTNETRAETADAGLRTFQRLTRTDNCDLVADFLCNLMHWCRANNEDFAAMLDRAKSNFTAEVEEEEEEEEGEAENS